MADKFRQVVNQVKDTMLGPKDKLVLSEENWDYICQTFDYYERSKEQQKVINAAQKKKTDELGVKLLDEKKRTTTLEERLDGLQKKTENLEQVVATLFEIIEIQQQMIEKDSISKPSVGLKPLKDDPALKDNKLPPTLQASTASSLISIRKKQIGSTTSSKKLNGKNDNVKVPIIRKTKVSSASKSNTVKGQERTGSLLSRDPEDSISKGESTVNEKKPGASLLVKSSAPRQMIKQSKDHPNSTSVKPNVMIDKSDLTPVKGNPTSELLY